MNGAEQTDSLCDTDAVPSTSVETGNRAEETRIRFAVLRNDACGALSPTPDSTGSKHDAVLSNQLDGRSDGERRARSSWRNARQRCNNPANRDYAQYGGRGIRFAPEWDKFTEFFRDMGSPLPGHTLDRIDTNGDYSPGNCRWSPAREQARNRRSNRAVKWLGEIRTVAAWSEVTTIPSKTISARLNKGWQPERALGTPYQARAQGYQNQKPRLEPHKEGIEMSGQSVSVSLDEAAKQAFTVRAIERVFELACAECFPRLYVRPLRGKPLKMAEQMLKDATVAHVGRMLVVVVRNWTDFACSAAAYGEFVQPEIPSIEFISRNLGAAVNFYADTMRPADLSSDATFEQIIAAIDEAETVSTTIPSTMKMNGSSMEKTANSDA